MVNFKLVESRNIYFGLHLFRPRALSFLTDLCTYFNHTVEFIVADTETSEVINGTWTGILGTLVRGEADMSVLPHVYDSQFAEIVDVQYFAFMESIGILAKEKTSTTLGDVMGTFYNTEVRFWILMSLVIFIVTMFNKITAILISIANDKVHSTHDNNLLTLFGHMLYRGSPRNPKRISTRILLQFYLFSAMIFACFFYANMKSSVTMIRPKFYKTIDDILQDEHANILFFNSRTTVEMFQNSPIAEYRQFWKRVNTPPGNIIEDIAEMYVDINERIAFMSQFEKLNLVCIGALSFMTAFAENMRTFFKENIVLMEYRMKGLFHFNLLRKNMEQEKAFYLKRINSYLAETGLIFPLFEFINGKIPYYVRKSGEPREVEMESLMLPSLSNAVKLWAVGLLASGLCFVAEIGFKKFTLNFRICRCRGDRE